MAATLAEILLAPGTLPHVVDDCLTLIDREVSDKSGVGGTGIKLAYKTAKTFAPNYLHNTMESLLPDIADKLQPFWADFSESGGSDFGDYLSKRGEEVSEALLQMADHRATLSDRPVIVKAYQAVRGTAARHIEAALPAVGQLVAKYASAA
ncbi:MAG TPA: hypothetical protein VMA95_18585 [Streptosporangiaceae bacterium]|nr:hypothetical protein [Streptosporangiaceae bacterium]